MTCAAIRNAERKMRTPKFPVPIRQPDPKRNPGHLAWIRTLPCAVKGCCSKAIQAAHVRVETGGGMGMKPADAFSVPLCVEHHLEQHRVGHAAFDAAHMLDLRALAEELAAMSPAVDHRNSAISALV